MADSSISNLPPSSTRKNAAKLIPCKHCGKLFKKFSHLIKADGNFCSRICYDAYRGSQSERVCAYCGITFNPHRSEASIFCSQECSMNATADKNSCMCKWCNQTFKIKDGKRCENGNFCSRECYASYRKSLYVSYKCLNCGCEFSRPPSREVVNFCSRECNFEYTRGDKHYLYKGGKKHYRGQNWGKQRNLAYERDGGVCQYCYRKRRLNERQFQVHHIRPFREFGKDYITANDLLNLITLCPQCHAKAEAGLIPVPKRLL